MASKATPSAASPQQAQQKLYRTLHDQLDLALYPQALRTVKKLLARDPQDQLARQTHSQLVVALDRYPDALKLDSTDDLTRAYCLYKLARPQEAQSVLEQAAEREGDDRANEVLEAQLSYRLGDYERARDLFDELAATAEADSPELADLEANLGACTAQLDFVAEIPTTLANLSSSGSRAIPPIDQLEARPLALVLPAASTSNLGAASDRGERTRTARRRPRGARFAASASTTSEGGATTTSAPRIPAEVAQQPAPAEDRWIPKRQRPSMRDALLQAKEKQRGRKRDKVLAAMAATQGAAAGSASGEEPKAKATGTGGGGGGGAKTSGGGGNKKKKGGRK